MKKLILFVICLSLLFVGAALAGPYDREDTKAGYVKTVTKTSDAVMVGRPCYIYGLTIYATSSNSFANFYDSASTGSNLIIEIGEATQYNTKRYEFNPPIQAENGLYVDVTNCYAIAEYR